MSQIQANISLASNIVLPQSFHDKLLITFGYCNKQIKQSRDKLQTNDIYKLKEWLDENIDLMAPMKKYQQAKDNNDTKTMEALQQEWIKEAMEKENKTAIETKQNDEFETKDNNDNSIQFPVQVFVRFRPLIQSEIESKHNEITYKTKTVKNNSLTTIIINDITKKQRKSNIQRPGKNNINKTVKIPIKKFKGFQSIISANDNNINTFKKCILPSIDCVLKGFNVCCFAYGHTGSGKTHTILGYDETTSPGMYRLTAKYIIDKIETINKNIKQEKDKILLSCRFAELYQGKMRDLFGNLVECFVREDDNGIIHIRGPTIHDKQTGNVKVQPLKSIYISNGQVNVLINEVNKSLKLRKQGSSAVHDESSRSHVFLQMELVNKRLIDARHLLWDLEGEYTPIGKQIVEISEEYKRFKSYEQTGEYRFDFNYKPSNDEIIHKKNIETRSIEYQIEIEKAKKLIKIENESNQCIGGKLIFVDLAGNEWGNDSKNIKGDKQNNKIQMKERQEINKSLLALKECIRALHSNKDHIPYRDSKLTMVLKPHLKAKTSTAIMIANVSPSDNHIQKTYNTLKYSQLVAKA